MAHDVSLDQAAELARWAVGQQVGSIAVLDATGTVDEDVNGRAAVFVDLTLTDPLPSEETWPIDDILALHRVVDARAREMRIDWWHVRLQAVGDPPAEEE